MPDPIPPKAPIPHEVKSHPDYSDGYHEAMRGYSFDTDRADSEPYCYGFEAGGRAVELFRSNGFSRSAGGFSIRLSTKDGSQ